MAKSSESSLDTSSSEAQLEGITSRVKNLVNQNGIKLWLSPYYDSETGPDEGKLLELAVNLSTTLELEDTDVLQGLVQLQDNALEKLQARECFKSQGKIMLKLRLTKNLTLKADEAKTHRGKKNILEAEIDSNAMAKDLLEYVRQRVEGVGSIASLKAIFSGKILDEDGLLTSQDVKPGAVVMIAKIDPKDESLLRAAEQRGILEGVRADAEMLGSQSDAEGGGRGLEIRNQNGEKLAIPDEEQKSLIMAMSLDEKGRACLRRGDFELGLVMLLEASREYQNCRSDILERSDNYAVLNLEIGWCYLRLNHISQLPDAEARLKESERILGKIHGPNLERVLAVKGSAANEQVLYMRLHLMQGIVAFHMGQKEMAAYKLGQAKTELGKLQVSEDAVAEVCALGYSEKEARLSLRVSEGNVAGAVRHAQGLREDRERVEKANAKRRKYGKTVGGNWVNLGKVTSLSSMGFHEDLIVTALRTADNDLNEAIDMIQNRPDMLEMTMATEAAERSAASKKLRRDDPEAGPSKAKKVAEAYDRMKEDIGDENEDEYLNLTLEEEEGFLTKYLEYMK